MFMLRKPLRLGSAVGIPPLAFVVGLGAIMAPSCLRGENRAKFSAGELVQRILQSEGYQSAAPLFEQLHNLAADERNAALLELVQEGTPDIATNAAIILIHQNAVETVQEIASHMIKLSAERQTQVLDRLRSFKRTEEPWMEIPRAVLKALPHQAGPDPILKTPRFHITDPLGRSALLLATYGRPSDHRLIRSALPFEAESSLRIWTACTRLRFRDESMAELARDVMSDPAVATTVRVAAAAAIADTDKRALDYMISEVQRFITQYGEQSVESLQISSLTEANGNRGLLDYIRFQSDLQMMAFLQFLAEEAVKGILHDGLMASNRLMAMTAAVVTLRKSPKSLLETDIAVFSDDEYSRIVAAATFLDPSLEFAVRDREMKQGITAAKAKIESNGLGSIFGEIGAPLELLGW
jgi:hypothetical protein